jgi:SpoIID/LytB domain protein
MSVRQHRPARLMMIALMVVALLPLTGANASRAQAADHYPRSADGSFGLQGHGYGHGTGMSQWGSQGAAKAGLTYAQILGHYYPGTTLATGGPSSLEVWISADNDNNLWVRPSTGLAVTVGTTKDTLPTSYAGAGYSSWRVRLVTAQQDGQTLYQQRVEGYASGAWRHFKTYGGPARLTNDAALIRVVLPGGTEREYRGSLRARTAGGKLYTVNDVTMTDYLRSVVPAESPSSWEPAALQAQSVAARTYASRQAQTPPTSFYDICDTVNCQVYSGAASIVNGQRRVHEATSTNNAVAATAGKVLTYGGALAFTQFSASNGGYSSSGGIAYLPAKADKYDSAGGANPNHTWTTSLTAATIQAKYPQIGFVQALRVLERDGNGDWGGRIKSITIEGSRASVTLTGPTFRFAFGLKSEWFHVLPPTCPVVTRLYGTTRYATSVAEGRAAFPTSTSVVIVSADPAHMADGVVAAPFAYRKKAPVLLTERTGLPDVVSKDIADRGVTTAYVIGGEIPISPAVDAELAALGVKVVRIAGPSRYATAALVADAMGVDPSSAFIASGDPHHLIDALVAGGPAARLAWPILLTRRDALPAETAAALQRLTVSKTYVLGGALPITDSVVSDLQAAGRAPERLAGASLYDTATAVARTFETAVGTDRVLVASGARGNIIDALGGGTFGRIIVLSGPDALPSASATWIRENAPYTGVTVVGGPLAVSDAAVRGLKSVACG